MDVIEMDISDKTIIDMDEGIHKANGNEGLAKELLGMLVAELPNDKAVINESYSEGDLKGTHDKIHQLHGGCSYCGVPSLKAIVYQLDDAFRREQTQNLAAMMDLLNEEMDKVIEAYTRLTQQ